MAEISLKKKVSKINSQAKILQSVGFPWDGEKDPFREEIDLEGKEVTINSGGSPPGTPMPDNPFDRNPQPSYKNGKVTKLGKEEGGESSTPWRQTPEEDDVEMNDLTTKDPSDSESESGESGESSDSSSSDSESEDSESGDSSDLKKDKSKSGSSKDDFDEKIEDYLDEQGLEGEEREKKKKEMQKDAGSKSDSSDKGEEGSDSEDGEAGEKGEGENDLSDMGTKSDKGDSTDGTPSGDPSGEGEEGEDDGEFDPDKLADERLKNRSDSNKQRDVTGKEQSEEEKAEENMIREALKDSASSKPPSGSEEEGGDSAEASGTSVGDLVSDTLKSEGAGDVLPPTELKLNWRMRLRNIFKKGLERVPYFDVTDASRVIRREEGNFETKPAPRTVVLVCDMSGSMNESKYRMAFQQLDEVLKSLPSSSSNYEVVFYTTRSEKMSDVVKLKAPRKISNKLSGISGSGGLESGIFNFPLPYGLTPEKIDLFMFFTDGQFTQSMPEHNEYALRVIRKLVTAKKIYWVLTPDGVVGEGRDSRYYASIAGFDPRAKADGRVVRMTSK